MDAKIKYSDVMIACGFATHADAIDLAKEQGKAYYALSHRPKAIVYSVEGNSAAMVCLLVDDRKQRENR